MVMFPFKKMEKHARTDTRNGKKADLGQPC